MTQLAQGIPVPVRTSFEDNYRLTPEQLEEAITDKTRVLILCSPSNPTGSCYSKEGLRTFGGTYCVVIPTFLLYRTKFTNTLSLTKNILVC